MSQQAVGRPFAADFVTELTRRVTMILDCDNCDGQRHVRRYSISCRSDSRDHGSDVSGLGKVRVDNHRKLSCGAPGQADGHIDRRAAYLSPEAEPRTPKLARAFFAHI